MSRKSKRNIGNYEVGAETELRAHTPVLMPERLIKALLQATVEQLKADPSEATRFFSHFFDASVDEKERDQFVAAFLQRPPKTQLGYARMGAELPIFAIVMTEEEEDEAFLGDHTGTEDDEEFTGAFFNAVYTVLVYTGHPDMCQVLYQFAKAVVHAGKGLLFSLGVLEVSLSGGDIAPDEVYLPENMFVRALRVKAKHPYSAPRFKPVDPDKVRTFIFGPDVVIDGMKGGIKFTHTPGEDDDE